MARKAAKQYVAPAIGRHSILAYTSKAALPTPEDTVSEDGSDAIVVYTSCTKPNKQYESSEPDSGSVMGARPASNIDPTPLSTQQAKYTKPQSNVMSEQMSHERPLKRRLLLSHIEINCIPPTISKSTPVDDSVFQPLRNTSPPTPIDTPPAECVCAEEVPANIPSKRMAVSPTSARPRRSGRVSYFPIFNQPGLSSDEEDAHAKKSRKRKRGSDDDDDFDEEALDQSDDESSPGTPALSMPSSDNEGQAPVVEHSAIRSRKSTRAVNQVRKPQPALYADDLSGVERGNPKMRMLSLVDRKALRGIRHDLPPLSKISDIFAHLTEKAINQGLDQVASRLGARAIRVATMCSGTESPLLALEMISKCLAARGLTGLAVVHVFSAEIEPYKQAYIERNFQPPLIFRDIVEITNSRDGKATTIYGAKVDIPDDIDILIAGTACVDYSALNRRKKGIEDGGESGDTFKAVLEYARRYRPRIVILENTFNAPWIPMLNYYEDLNYSAAGVKVDTKEYYLPQTRQRGYMVCIDRRDTNLTKTQADALVKNWQELMKKMKRPVSSPVSDFLLPNDDRQVVLARDRLARQTALDSTIRDQDWAKCEEVHRNYRMSQRLGYARPYTSWEPSGMLDLYDYVDRTWLKGQVERIWDVLECSVLRKAHDYDVTFKTRIWNLSQNIHRFTDTTPFGIATCLTPTGIFYLTDSGRPLTFPELLGLQGLPMEKLVFTSETERQVQDLAGNAMSTTVVGSAIIAALICAKDVLWRATSGRQPVESTEQALPEIAGTDDLVPVQSVASNLELDVAAMVEHAMSATMLCHCEGQIALSKKRIQVCADCQHTTCLSCGGKPPHNYQVADYGHRRTPESFIQKWRSQVPMRLHLSHKLSYIESMLRRELSQIRKAVEKEVAERFIEAASNAISGDFTFSSFRRSSRWTITYEATYARLVLIIEPNGVRWELFALPDASLAGNDPLRLFLQRPIARSFSSENFLGATSWEWRVPDTIRFGLSFSARGHDIPSWTARLGLPGEENKTVPQILCVEHVEVDVAGLALGVAGTYEHLRSCGTASESLYKKKDHIDAEPVFLFLDPARLGQGKDDNFVFSSNPERLFYDQTRDVIASLDCNWRPWGNDISAATATTDGRWISKIAASLEVKDSSLEIFGHLDIQSIASHSKCNQAFALVSCMFPIGDGVPTHYQGSRQIKPNDKEYFSAFAWAFEPLRRHIVLERDLDIPAGKAITCATCAPSLPVIEWKNGLTKTGLSIRPFEDPKSATSYEIALKSRPEIFTVQSVVDTAQGTISVGINHMALTQRAFAKLQKMIKYGHTSTTWSLDTQFSGLPLTLPAFHLRSNDPECSVNVTLPSKVQLWTKQKQSLAWMRSQEANQGKEIVLEAREEALLPYLGWRAEARARASQYVRGGILADHPGFGKTITSLSLIHSEFEDHVASHDPNAEIKREMRDLPTHLEGHTGAKGDDYGPIKLAATLVICPGTLGRQWYTEVEKVLGKAYKEKTILISTIADLKRYTIAQFQKARIIILDRGLLGRENYLERVAAFTGMPLFGAANSRRDFKAWLRAATDKIYAHTHILQHEGPAALAKAISETTKHQLENNTFRSFASKRLKGAAYMKKAAEAVKTSESMPESDLQKAFSKLDQKELQKVVLFEMFMFNRIIIDEFTYMLDNDSGSMTSVTALMADKRWALSATPPLKDAYDVAQLARVIGINLNEGFCTPGLLSSKNLATIQEDMTNVELFELFSESPTHTQLTRVHDLAQKFLDDFVRQNIQRFEDFEYNDYVVPVTLHLDHGLVYNELSHQLNSQDMRVKRVNKTNAKGQDRDERIHEAVFKIQEAEQALSNRATFFTSDEFESGRSGLDGLLQKRKEERQSHKEDLEKAIVLSQSLNATCTTSEYPFELWQKAVLPSNELGDQDVTNTIKAMITRAERKQPTPQRRSVPQAKGKKSEDSDAEAGSEDETAKEKVDPDLVKMRAARSDVNQAAKKFLAATRSVRFVESTQLLQSKLSDGRPLAQCDFRDCHGHVDMHTVAISSVCGHVICEPCFTTSQHGAGNCGAPGCKTYVRKFQLLPIRRMGDMPPQTPSIKADQGKKVATVVEILQRIQRLGQQAILFVRAEDHIKKMQIVLEANDVQCEAIVGHTSSRITRFQETTTGPDKKTVIILNADDESAAGTNLTNANHVIFLSPLLKIDQYGYESQMAQAIGRVRRPGQKNDIFVYRMVALHTVDVDVLEHRERNNRILIEKKVSDICARKPEEDVQMTDADGHFTAHETSEQEERMQLIRDEDGLFKLVPRSLLLSRRQEGEGMVDIEGGARVKGFEDFNALIKFSKAYADG